MQTSYGRDDHRERHRYRSRLCARQHDRDHRVPIGRVRDRMVHRSAAPAPPRTERRRVTQRAAVAPWPAARITLIRSRLRRPIPGEALSPKHEAFVQAYVSRGMNGTKAYRAVYPSIKSDDVAGAAAARLSGNVRVQARIAEIMGAGAERAEVTVEQVVRELKLIGFSDIRKVVSWRNELVTRTEKGEDGEPVMVMMP